MEHVEPLNGCGYRYHYDDALFPPGTDSFLLSAYPGLRRGARVCDLGCGTGLLGLLLLRREPSLHITGIELDPAAAALARKNADANALSAQWNVLTADLRDPAELPARGFDLAVSNPPYFPPGSGFLPRQKALQPARAELKCTLEDLCRTAVRLLRWDGRLCLVYRPERLTDLLCALRGSGLEPKRLRFVEPRAGAAPSLVLAEAVRGGKPGVRLEPPLLLQNADGTPSAEVEAIYFKSQETTP